MNLVVAPLSGKVIELLVQVGDSVSVGDALLVLESMNMHVNVEAEDIGLVSAIDVDIGSQIERGATLIQIASQSPDETIQTLAQSQEASDTHSLVKAFAEVDEAASDEARPVAVQKRVEKNSLSARQNLELYCSKDGFVEFGRLAVAAQQSRRSIEDLRTNTAADGVVTGIGDCASPLFSSPQPTAFVINDYSVLAGTQGFYHHAKIDRMLEVAEQRKLPIIMYTEGGGGRPGDTDISHINTGLGCTTFSNWAGLAGVVPRIAVAHGYNFAGNAALFGAADIKVATTQSWIGMAGPAMIEGGGLGKFSPKEIGPAEMQAKNGVVDLLVEDETEAAAKATHILSIVCQKWAGAKEPAFTNLDTFMPENRRHTYDVIELLGAVFDRDSLIELREHYGGAIKTLFATLSGRSVGVIASNCQVLGGAVDVPAGRKAAEFMKLCDSWGIPLVFFSDTPGFMVGPAHEELGAVSELAAMFAVGAKLTVPTLGVVIRKCYGLGGQALLSGSTKQPDAVVAWPTGEFGAMGIEGAVTLGFKKELEAAKSDEARQQLFDELVEEQYRRGSAVEVATKLEIDGVIKPSATRNWLLSTLNASNRN